MKIQSLVMTLAIAASTTLSGIAFAQTATPVVDQKAANQHQPRRGLRRVDARRSGAFAKAAKQIGHEHTTR